MYDLVRNDTYDKDNDKQHGNRFIGHERGRDSVEITNSNTNMNANVIVNESKT